MSWKMFWQIVLLIIIAAVVSSTVKMGMMRCKVLGMGMGMDKECPSKGMMRR